MSKDTLIWIALVVFVISVVYAATSDSDLKRCINSGHSEATCYATLNP